MGISIVETVLQTGHIDPRTYFGKGRLEDIADERGSTLPGHPWEGVDLAIVHTNATPRQLVGVSQALGVEVWDRVRLLLALFTAHASSVEAARRFESHNSSPTAPSSENSPSSKPPVSEQGTVAGVSLRCKASLPTSIEN